MRKLRIYIEDIILLGKLKIRICEVTLLCLVQKQSIGKAHQWRL